jgi:hypothetical protein
VLLFSCRVLSTICDAGLMLVAMSLPWCSLGRFPNSKPGMVLARRRILRVGILKKMVSSASVG